MDVLGVGGLVHGAAFAHDVRADGPVRHLRADVEGLGQGIEIVEVLGEGLPVPLHAGGESGAGDVLDALHEADKPLVAVGGGGGEADAAVPHHDGGDAVPAGGREQRVPGDLAVEVGVDVDEARGDNLPRCVDRLAALGLDAADGGYLAVVDGDVALEGSLSRPIDNGAVADNQIVHVAPPGAGAAALTRGAPL